MEGYMRTRTLFMDGACRRCWWFFTCRRSRYREKLIKGKYPKVRSALDPAQILWQNLGYNMWARRGRRCLTTLIGLVIVFVCIAINLYATRADEAIQSFSPQVQCSPDITYDAESAFSDFQKGKGDQAGQEQQGLMTCFCIQEWEKNTYIDYTFPDGEMHCVTWFGMYTLTNSLIYLVPVGIGLANYIASVLLRKMSEVEKHHNISE